MSDKEGVEEAIMTNNNKRFKLTYGTPLMNGSRLSKDIGLLANTPSAKQILDGTYNFPPGTDSHTIKLLKHIGEVARHIGHEPNTICKTYARWDIQLPPRS